MSFEATTTWSQDQCIQKFMITLRMSNTNTFVLLCYSTYYIVIHTIFCSVNLKGVTYRQHIIKLINNIQSRPNLFQILMIIFYVYNYFVSFFEHRLNIKETNHLLFKYSVSGAEQQLLTTICNKWYIRVRSDT